LERIYCIVLPENEQQSLINNKWQEDAGIENPNLWESLTNYHGSDNDESVMPDPVICERDNEKFDSEKSSDRTNIIEKHRNISDQTQTVKRHGDGNKRYHVLQGSDKTL
jgi:hypothetical protein